MAAFKLPRLKANLAIVSGDGKPTDFFLRLFNIDLVQRIEQQETNQDAVLAQLAEVQATQEAQLVLINEALELAGIAIGQSPGNSGSTTSVVTLDGTWTLGPQVDLLGVVAGDLTIPGSGLFATVSTTAEEDGTDGELRLVEIVGGVDTIIGGPWDFAAVRFGSNPSVYFSNPSEINALSLALTTTGAVSYRMDARVTTPSRTINNAQLKLYVNRTT